MTEDVYPPEELENHINRVSGFLDPVSMNRIINKLTDYAETIPEGKLAGIINFNFSLDSHQTNTVIDLLLEVQALTKINNIAQKGTRDLEEEFVSNVISDTITPENISSYISIRNIIENRLSHQLQQYNMNMNKANTTMAMPLNELRGHVKTFIDLSRSHVTVSAKAQHGYIAASLHDAYIVFIKRDDWWNDRTYMKFFFNEEDLSANNNYLISRKKRLSVQEINKNVQKLIEYYTELKSKKVPEPGADNKADKREDITFEISTNKEETKSQSSGYNDRMLLTPFGQQYGNKIDKVIENIFSIERQKKSENFDEEKYRVWTASNFEEFIVNEEIIRSGIHDIDIIQLVDFLIFSDYTVKSFTEKFIYGNRKEPFTRFYNEETKKRVDEFITSLFTVYFNHEFATVFRIIKSTELKKFACAFILKRIYLKQGEELTTFGYFLIKTIGKAGKIRVD